MAGKRQINKMEYYPYTLIGNDPWSGERCRLLWSNTAGNCTVELSDGVTKVDTLLHYVKPHHQPPFGS